MLLDRLSERAALSQLLDAARSGRSSVLVMRGQRVEGEGVGGEVVVGHEELRVGAVEDYDGHSVVLLDGGEHLGQGDDHLRVDEVDRRVVEGDTPVLRAVLGDGQLGRAWHGVLLWVGTGRSGSGGGDVVDVEGDRGQDAAMTMARATLASCVEVTSWPTL